MSSTTQSAPSWQHGKVAGWIVSVDHKRIGALYLGWAGVFFVIAGILTVLMRLQMTRPNASILGDSTYKGVLTMHGTLLVFFVLVPVVIGLATYLVPLMIGADAHRDARPRSGRALALRLRRDRGRPLGVRVRRLVEGRLDRVPARHPDAGGQRRPPLADGPVPARALGRRVGGQSRRDDPLAPRRGDGLGQDAAVRLVGVRVVGGDDRARAARRDRARPDPARAPVQRLVRLLPHRRPDRQAVAGLAVRAVVRLRRARAGRRRSWRRSWRCSPAARSPARGRSRRRSSASAASRSSSCSTTPTQAASARSRASCC